MIMDSVFLAFLTQVEVVAHHASESLALDRVALASVTSDSLMSVEDWARRLFGLEGGSGDGFLFDCIALNKN